MKAKLCKPVLVQDSRYAKRNDLAFYFGSLILVHGNSGHMYKQQLILISLENDTIKTGDKYYNNMKKEIQVCENNVEADSLNHFIGEECFKVIATQDQLPEAYIKRFIQEYNWNKVKDVRIEVELDGHFEEISCFDYIPKLLNGEVIIKREVKYNFSFYDVRFVIDQFICEECPQYSQKGNGGTYLHKFIKERGIEPSVIYTEEEFKEKARIAFEDSCKYSSFEDFYKEHKKQ